MRQSAALKLLQQLEPDLVDAPASRSGPLPRAPQHLDAEGKKKWREIISEIDGTDDQGTLDTLSLYCVAWARWKAAEAKVAELGTVIKSPSGFPIQNPYLSISNKAFDQVMKAGRRLGLADPQ